MEQLLINLAAGALGGVGAGKSSPTFDLGMAGNVISGLVGGGVLGIGLVGGCLLDIGLVGGGVLGIGLLGGCLLRVGMVGVGVLGLGLGWLEIVCEQLVDCRRVAGVAGANREGVSSSV